MICDCGSKAKKMRFNLPVCERCDRLEREGFTGGPIGEGRKEGSEQAIIKRPRNVMLKGKTLTEWAKVLNIPRGTLHTRIAMGWTTEKVLGL